MAKRKRQVSARKPAHARDDDSLLVRSAESLGRVIGSLQRQVQGGTKRVSTMAESARDSLPELPRFDQVFGDLSRAKRKAARKPAARGKRAAAGATKTAARRRRSGRKAVAKKR